MRKINRACHLLILGTAIFGLSAARAGTIFDGFEGASISPFWTVVGPGTVTLSNAVAFAGTQSVEIVSNFPQLDELTHDFGTDWQGSVSVYVQGASMCCGAQAGLQIEDGSQNWLAVLKQTTPTNFIARVQPGGNPPESDFPFTSSAGWHLFEVDARQQRPDHEVRWLCGAQPTLGHQLPDSRSHGMGRHRGHRPSSITSPPPLRPNRQLEF